MIIKTNGKRCGKIRIATEHNEAPRWNDFHKAFYVWGYRWIESKQAFSGSCTLSNFTSWKDEQSLTTVAPFVSVDK